MSEKLRKVQLVRYDKSGQRVGDIDIEKASNFKLVDFDTNYDAKDGPVVGTDTPDDAIIRPLYFAIYNGEAIALTFAITDDTTQVYPDIPVNAGKLEIINADSIKGLRFSTSIAIDPTGAFTSGSKVGIGYYYEPIVNE